MTTPQIVTLSKSVSGLWAIELRDADIVTHHILRRATGNNRTDDPEYRICRPAQPFLQGGAKEKSGWILIEFWTNDLNHVYTFVNHINTEIQKAWKNPDLLEFIKDLAGESE